MPYDHGPAIQRQRIEAEWVAYTIDRSKGEPVIGKEIRSAVLREPEVTVGDAADPDRPNRTIRRARRVWAPDVLLAQAAIEQPHHDAAMRYHDAYAVGILGARDRLSVYVDKAGAPRGFAEAQLFAATDFRKATQAAGIVASPILSWCVLSHGTVRGYAETRGWDGRKAMGYLLAALDRLVEHYGMR